jgi:hypothetical protein
MSEKDNGGPAFPNPYIGADPLEKGMTLRDWFAGQAMTAAAIQAFDDDSTVEQNARVAAAWSYAIADAMLEARYD